MESDHQAPVYDKLDEIGKIMLDVAKVFITGGRPIPPEYKLRILKHRKRPAV